MASKKPKCPISVHQAKGKTTGHPLMKWYHKTTGKNGEDMATSELYSSKSNAVRGKDDMLDLIEDYLVKIGRVFPISPDSGLLADEPFDVSQMISGEAMLIEDKSCMFNGEIIVKVGDTFLCINKDGDATRYDPGTLITGRKIPAGTTIAFKTA